MLSFLSLLKVRSELPRSWPKSPSLRRWRPLLPRQQPAPRVPQVPQDRQVLREQQDQQERQEPVQVRGLVLVGRPTPPTHRRQATLQRLRGGIKIPLFPRPKRVQAVAARVLEVAAEGSTTA